MRRIAWILIAEAQKEVIELHMSIWCWLAFLWVGVLVGWYLLSLGRALCCWRKCRLIVSAIGIPTILTICAIVLIVTCLTTGEASLVVHQMSWLFVGLIVLLMCAIAWGLFMIALNGYRLWTFDKWIINK